MLERDHGVSEQRAERVSYSWGPRSNELQSVTRLSRSMIFGSGEQSSAHEHQYQLSYKRKENTWITLKR